MQYKNTTPAVFWKCLIISLSRTQSFGLPLWKTLLMSNCDIKTVFKLCGADPGSIIVVTELYWSQCCVTSTCCRFTLKLTSSVSTGWIYTLCMSDTVHFSFFHKQSRRKEQRWCLFKKKLRASKKKRKKQGGMRFKYTFYHCKLIGHICIALIYH